MNIKCHFQKRVGNFIKLLGIVVFGKLYFKQEQIVLLLGTIFTCGYNTHLVRK